VSYVVSTSTVGFYRGQDYPGGIPIAVRGVSAALAPEESRMEKSRAVYCSDFFRGLNVGLRRPVTLYESSSDCRPL
jgi:hypothetical protein